jgi:hypothetical protein
MAWCVLSLSEKFSAVEKANTNLEAGEMKSIFFPKNLKSNFIHGLNTHIHTHKFRQHHYFGGTGV